MRGPNRRRAVFLDVDGTLVDHDGLVPDSAVETVSAARANGHQVFLCTGRSLHDLWPSITQIGFDGLVAGGGAYVSVNKTVLRHQRMSEAEVVRVMALLERYDLEYFLESMEHLNGTPGVRGLMQAMLDSPVDEAARARRHDGLGGYLDSLLPLEAADLSRVHKMSFAADDEAYATVQAALTDEYTVRRSTVHILGETGAELAPRGVNKGVGMALLLDHAGIDRTDTLAIGDGYNDVEMLTFAAVGIAMADAPAELREVADEVTSGPAEGGIRIAFRRHGLID